MFSPLLNDVVMRTWPLEPHGKRNHAPQKGNECAIHGVIMNNFENSKG